MRGDPLTESVRVRMTAGERDLLERVARQEGRTLSGLIRHASVTYSIHATPPDAAGPSTTRRTPRR